MSGASSSSVGGKTYDTSMSDAYANAGAPASQVQAIRNQEISYQNSQNSGGSASTSSLYPKAVATVNPLTGVNNNNYFNGGGYAYNDKYGISHVVDDYGTALKYSGDGNVQSYNGAFGGGYALNKDGNAMSLPGSTYSSPNLVGYDSSYGALSALVPTSRISAAGLIPSTTTPISNVATKMASSNLLPLTTSTTPTMTWQQSLENYRTNRTAGEQEIARAQSVYQQKILAGDYAGAEAAHQWANQIREVMGVANQYDSVTGEYRGSTPAIIPTATTSTAPLTPDPVAKLTEMIQNATAQQGQAPVYQPYQQQAFQYTAPNYSITSNPADTSFIPTAKAKDRWLQQEQANADEAYKGYSSNYNAYQQGYNATQDAIANALSLLPYSELNAYQKASLEQQQAEAALNAELAKQAAAQEQANWEAEQAYDWAKLNGSGSGGSGGGSGGSNSGSPTTGNNGYYVDSAGERGNVATGQLYTAADNQYIKNLNSASGSKAAQRPLYYALDAVLNNSSWTEKNISSGADVKKVVDSLIVKYAKTTPSEYMKTQAGSRVAAAYSALTKK